MLVDKKIEPVIRRIISTALVQIFYQYGVAKEVAVDVAVNYVQKIRNRKTGGFVNAVLRNAIRKTFVKAEEDLPECVKYNVPDLLLNRWSNFFPLKERNRIIALIKKQAPLTFRLMKPIDESVFKNTGCDIITNFPWCNEFSFYKTERPDIIIKMNLIDSGIIYIQDPATTMAPTLINGKISGKILDICAAPGGKTLILSELHPEAEIVAMDRSAKRLQQVVDNVKRAQKKNIVTVVADALDPPFEKNSFNVVFADVPCSNTGVSRRRPDVIWRFNQKRLTQILKLQMDILKSASNLVKPGGRLVYSTCSIEFDENRKQIDKFLKYNDEFTFVRDKLLLPAEENDGAYAAVVRKRDS